MKYIFLLLSLCSLMSCATSNKKSSKQTASTYEIYQMPIVSTTDTAKVYELRVKPKFSAMDGMRVMYENYGEWNKKIDSTLKNGAKKFIWEQVKLLNTEEHFTVIVDAIETGEAYYCSFVVFDSTHNHCFHNSHPLKTQLVNLFTSKIQTLEKNPNTYLLFKSKNVYSVHQTPIVVETDTAYVYELRVKPKFSAMDGMRAIYKDYGQWDEKIDGKYQSNIKQLIWNNVQLLNTEERFIVIADGTETQSAYFASLIVFDAKNNNCLNPNHPLNDQIIKSITTKIQTLNYSEQAYQRFN